MLSIFVVIIVAVVVCIVFYYIRSYIKVTTYDSSVMYVMQHNVIDASILASTTADVNRALILVKQAQATLDAIVRIVGRQHIYIDVEKIQEVLLRQEETIQRAARDVAHHDDDDHPLADMRH